MSLAVPGAAGCLVSPLASRNYVPVMDETLIKVMRRSQSWLSPKLGPSAIYSWGVLLGWMVLLLEQLWGGAWLLGDFPSIP